MSRRSRSISKERYTFQHKCSVPDILLNKPDMSRIGKLGMFHHRTPLHTPGTP